MKDKIEKAILDRKITEMYVLGQHENIKRYMSSLSHDKQMIMEQFYKQGKSLKEIAQICNISYASATNLRLRIIEELKQYLSISSMYHEYTLAMGSVEYGEIEISEQAMKEMKWLKSKWVDADLYNYFYKRSENELITNALYLLNKNQREMFKRFYGQNKNLKEIAEELHESHQAVLAWYSRAKKKLVEILYPAFSTKLMTADNATLVRERPNIKNRILEYRNKELTKIRQKKNLESQLKNMFAGLKGYEQLKQDFDSLDKKSQDVLRDYYSPGRSIIQFTFENRIRIQDAFVIKERAMTALLEKVRNRKIGLVMDKIKIDIENIADSRKIDEITIWRKIADEIHEEYDMICKANELE